MKITKAPSARTVWPRIKLAFQEISKPSLCRVAVSAIYADGDRESKNMERDRNRHKHPSFRRRPNRPSASGALGVQKNHIYSTKRIEKCQFMSPLSPPLDKSQESAIIKITQGSATSGFASGLRRKLDQKIKKPSLCRVAVSAFDADGDRESKDMECDRNRHLITSFTR